MLYVGSVKAYYEFMCTHMLLSAYKFMTPLTRYNPQTTKLNTQEYGGDRVNHLHDCKTIDTGSKPE